MSDLLQPIYGITILLEVKEKFYAMNNNSIKILLKISIILFGGLIGYGFYYFIGCNSGSCPISSNPYLSIAFGLILGLIFVFPTKKSEK